MEYTLPPATEVLLQELDTPWGRLLGIKSDRITRTIRADGIYEWAETAIVGQIVRVGAVTLDIGANIGYYCALLHSLVGESGQVHAFEANPFTATLLRRSVAANGWQNVVLNNRAVSDKGGEVTVRAMDVAGGLEADDLNLGGWSLSETADGEWTIPAITIDDYVEENGLERVHFCKVDVEGFELKVLHGGKAVLKRFRPYLLMEMRADNAADHGRCIEMRAHLDELGYVCCRIVKRPFPHFRRDLDTDYVGIPYHFNILAIPLVRYREYATSMNLPAA